MQFNAQVVDELGTGFCLRVVTIHENQNAQVLLLWWTPESRGGLDQIRGSRKRSGQHREQRVEELCSRRSTSTFSAWCAATRKTFPSSTSKSDRTSLRRSGQ